MFVSSHSSPDLSGGRGMRIRLSRSTTRRSRGNSTSSRRPVAQARGDLVRE
jgi:hypothetical protein